MKITRQELNKLVMEEIDKLDPELREGVLDYLKGAGGAAATKASDTGKSIAKAVGDKATAVKNKVGQVAGDIKNAGAVASLKGDVQRAVQESGMAMERFKNTFTDLLARAQALRLNDEEETIKAELNAIEQYQMNAGAIGGAQTPTGDMSGMAQDIAATPLTHSDMHGREKAGEWPSGTEQWADKTPTAVDLPPLNPKPTEKPKPVDFGPEQPFDWRSDKAKGKPKSSTVTGTSKTPIQKQTSGKKQTKPTMRTKLDKGSIKKAVDAAGGDINKAAKKLGITKQQMIQALQS